MRVVPAVAAFSLVLSVALRADSIPTYTANYLSIRVYNCSEFNGGCLQQFAFSGPQFSLAGTGFLQASIGPGFFDVPFSPSIGYISFYSFTTGYVDGVYRQFGSASPDPRLPSSDLLFPAGTLTVTRQITLADTITFCTGRICVQDNAILVNFSIPGLLTFQATPIDSAQFDITSVQFTPTAPEPGTWLTLAGGAGVVIAVICRRTRRRA